MLANHHHPAKDFIQKLLVKEPEQRLTAEQCLEHPWLKVCCLDGQQLNHSLMHCSQSLAGKNEQDLFKNGNFMGSMTQYNYDRKKIQG